MSVLISHPSVAPFVQQAARALHEASLLHAFHTTVVHAPHRRAQRLLARLSSFAGYDLAAQFARRTVTDIPADRVHDWPTRELARLFVAKLDRGARAADLVWEWAELGFDRHIARQLTPDVRAVYGYEHCSAFTFAAARARGIHTLYDVPAPEPSFVQAMLD